MFHTYPNTTFLNGMYDLRRKLARQKWVFSKAFEPTPTQGTTSDVYSGSQQNVNVLGNSFSDILLSNPCGQVSIETGSESDPTGVCVRSTRSVTVKLGAERTYPFPHQRLPNQRCLLENNHLHGSSRSSRTVAHPQVWYTF